MNAEILKFSDAYSRFWFMHLGFNFLDQHTGRTLTKGEMYRIHTAIADHLATGEPLPDQFKLVPREPAKRMIERHGRKIEIETLL